MKTKLTILTIVSLGIALGGCRKKYEHCDNAELCVKNIGSKNIAYGWNTSSLADTLKPGQSTCIQTGEFNADPKNESGSYNDFVTNGSSYRIKTTSCNTLKEIE